MADILNTPLDPRTVQSLMAALVQQKIREADPARQFALQEEQKKAAMIEEARQRLMGAGPTQDPYNSRDLITFGRDPRSGVMAFNNQGWRSNDLSSLPENQARVAQQYNDVAARHPSQSAVRPQAAPAGRNMEQMGMDMSIAGINPTIAAAIMERMFPNPNKLSDLQKEIFKAQLEDKKDQNRAERDEARDSRQFKRELYKTATDPKKLEMAQQAIASAINRGQDPRQVASNYGMNFMADDASAARGIMNWLTMGMVNPTEASNIRVEPVLPREILQVLAGSQPSAPAAPAQAQRIVVEKDGKRFSLPAAQLPEAEKQGYKQVR